MDMYEDVRETYEALVRELSSRTLELDVTALHDSISIDIKQPVTTFEGCVDKLPLMKRAVMYQLLYRVPVTIDDRLRLSACSVDTITISDINAAVAYAIQRIVTRSHAYLNDRLRKVYTTLAQVAITDQKSKLLNTLYVEGVRTYVAGAPPGTFIKALSDIVCNDRTDRPVSL